MCVYLIKKITSLEPIKVNSSLLLNKVVYIKLHSTIHLVYKLIRILDKT